MVTDVVAAIVFIFVGGLMKNRCLKFRKKKILLLLFLSDSNWFNIYFQFNFTFRGWYDSHCDGVRRRHEVFYVSPFSYVLNAKEKKKG